MRAKSLPRCLLLILALALSACGTGGMSSGGTTSSTTLQLPTATAVPTETVRPIATATALPPIPDGPPGAITGNHLMYPADSMPALVIYAINVNDSSRYFFVQTSAGQFSYTITGVAPGRYHVIAYLANGLEPNKNFKSLAGGYTAFVLCSATGSYDCPDHTLLLVTVQASTTVRDINPNDFYSGTYPPRPGT